MAKKKKGGNKKKGAKGGGGSNNSNGANAATTKTTTPAVEVKRESVVDDASNVQIGFEVDNGVCNAKKNEIMEDKSDEEDSDENRAVGSSADGLHDGVTADIASATTADESVPPKRESSVVTGESNSLVGDRAAETLCGRNTPDKAAAYECSEKSHIAINSDTKIGEESADSAKSDGSNSGTIKENVGEFRGDAIAPESEHESTVGEVINENLNEERNHKHPASESNEPLALDDEADKSSNASDRNIENDGNQNEIVEDNKSDHQAESIYHNEMVETMEERELEQVVSEDVLNMVMQSNGDNVIPPTPSRYSSSNISDSEMASTPTISASDDLEDASTPIVGKNMRSYSTDLIRETSLVEVDLDDEAEKKNEYSPAPVVRAFKGTPNVEVPSVSNENEGDVKNSYRRPSESDAFVFLNKALRRALGDDAKDASDGTLSLYIHWKADVTRAAERFRSYLKFREDNAYIFDEKPLLLSQDPKLSFLLQNGMVLAPENCRARDGSAVIILRAAKCDVFSHGCSDEDVSRAIFYMVQTVLDSKASDPLLGISVVLDLEGVVRKNVPSKLAKLLSKAKGCFPLRIKAIYVVAMPWWFPNHRRLFSPKLRERIFFLKEKSALYDYIEKDRLLEQDGGTLMNFDVQLWISSTMLKEIEIYSNKEI
mmetsp:Transcript_10929/g.22334  ORF Transcript_10929/g.22334 Transcript_10929/m.22334 type:complete len:658 (-) Transcript_10929:14-1987(-)